MWGASVGTRRLGDHLRWGCRGLLKQAMVKQVGNGGKFSVFHFKFSKEKMKISKHFCLSFLSPPSLPHLLAPFFLVLKSSDHLSLCFFIFLSSLPFTLLHPLSLSF